MQCKIVVRSLLAAALLATAVSSRAGTLNIEMVPVGDAGNVADSTGFGAVGYNYSIGKYDVTLAQYTAFLNAVAKTDSYGLYNSVMGNGFSTQGISQTGSPGALSYAVTGSAPSAANMPVFGVNWGDAARFCNWLDNGQGTAATVGDAYALTESGAYTLNGGTSQAALEAVSRNAGAIFSIPSENEWYKAAFYVGGGTNAGYWQFTTKSNVRPINTLPDTGNHGNFYDFFGTGNHGYTDPTNFLTPVGSFNLSPSPYGTYDMGGELFQWIDISDSVRGFRGGPWSSSVTALASSTRNAFDPTVENFDIGFRVASVPEPSSLALLLAGAVALLGYAWRRRK